MAIVFHLRGRFRGSDRLLPFNTWRAQAALTKAVNILFHGDGSRFRNGFRGEEWPRKILWGDS